MSDDESFDESQNESSDEQFDEDEEDEEGADLNSLDQYDGSDLSSDELDKDFHELESGLSLSNRLKVKGARKLYFDEQRKEYNSLVANEVSTRVKEKWGDLLGAVGGKSSMFDFQVLKSLLDDTQQEKNNSTQYQSIDKLDIKQQGDDWDYTIGLKREIDKAFAELDNVEDEEENEGEGSEDDEISFDSDED